jgi:hypothetical protein
VAVFVGFFMATTSGHPLNVESPPLFKKRKPRTRLIFNEEEVGGSFNAQ